jgi:hypothetical protein
LGKKNNKNVIVLYYNVIGKSYIVFVQSPADVPELIRNSLNRRLLQNGTKCETNAGGCTS